MSTGRKITIVGLSILVAILIVGSGVLFGSSVKVKGSFGFPPLCTNWNE